TLGMFFIAGDRIWRHNLPSLPVFVGPLAALFALGALVVVRRWQSQPYWFLAVWTGLFLLPTALAEDAPHYLRAIGALPAACILAALGIAAVVESRLGTSRTFSIGRLRLGIGLVFALGFGLMPHAVFTTYAYFNRYVTAPLTAYWLEAHNTALAREVNEAALNGEQVRIDTRLSSGNPALHFLSPAVAYVADMGGYLWLPGDAARGRLLVDPNHDWSTLRDALPQPVALSVRLGPMAQADRETTPRRAFITVHFTSTVPATDPLVEFEGGMSLLDALAVCSSTEEAGCRVALSWRLAQPRPEDLAVFVHWLREGQLLAQSDGTPGEGYLPIYFWRAGDIVKDAHWLRGAQWRAGDALHVGLYRRSDLSRLRVVHGRSSTGNDSVIITPSEQR
ncbi:MAG: hypothetical protein NZ693_02175, partial [Thermoflexales bacterium]|nr:hypothetical protein [Thermoflexales bacterium]